MLFHRINYMGASQRSGLEDRLRSRLECYGNPISIAALEELYDTAGVARNEEKVLLWLCIYQISWPIERIKH